ncbi:YbhB/YbcL family Raf kinase inhibitor-like protein [Vibrio sp. TH_r3]|uniref:YbhB/YbcL family Raf kinase inhibitor-like protein n=1 Tax=Vibrio sp. TH_r3 TaxID=3082084 RepID=UPI002952D278|nr:YbhB/YbcL family Raf kinase inhibitor-like protein [Vibrio sp. TH_r3]MDV7103817.1 YbhB/YbcL family Raf kinase inhibitor-like protein [Vibrio sp. TH_r3]
MNKTVMFSLAMVILPFSVVCWANSTITPSLSDNASANNTSLQLSSSAFIDGGVLPSQFTCEGEGISPPLNWHGVPEGTQSLVVIMDHIPKHGVLRERKLPAEKAARPNELDQPRVLSSKSSKSPKPPKPENDRLHWYWGMVNIPADVLSVDAGQFVGLLGNNSVNKSNQYAPPCSKGPGEKKYTFHLYALSDFLSFPNPSMISAETIRQSMRDLIIDSDSLTVSFTRSCRTPERPQPKPKNTEQIGTVPLKELQNNGTVPLKPRPETLPPCQ